VAPAVAVAYGWPWPLADAEILDRVVALNAARAAEEKAGVVRWLRPDFQAKGELLLAAPVAPAKKKTGKYPWPADLTGRMQTVEAALAVAEAPQTAADLAKTISRAKPADVEEILTALCSMKRARPGDAKGTFVRWVAAESLHIPTQTCAPGR
jgi:hypothetical protein